MSESRKHERVKTSEGSLALADGNMARIVDIGKGGISLLFLDNSLLNVPKTLLLDLLSIETKAMADQLPGELAWELETSFASIFGGTYKKVGIQFGELSPKQKNQLESLIVQYAAGRAEGLGEEGGFDTINYETRGENED